MEKGNSKTEKEVILETLKNATTRGDFKVSKSDFKIESTLKDKPISIRGKVFAKIENNKLVASDTAMDVTWNLEGRCIKGNNMALDLILL